MKKTAFCAVLAAVAVMAFSGCKADELPPSEEISEARETEISAEEDAEIFEETETEIFEETETEILEETENEIFEEEDPGFVSPYKGPDDFYIKITDCNGEEKLLYYSHGEDINDFYMNEMTDNPDQYYGFASAIMREYPGKKEKAFFGAELKKFIEQHGLLYSDCSYSPAEKTGGFALINNEEDPERFAKLIETIIAFEPEYVDELIGSDDEIRKEYDPRYLVTSVYVYDNFLSFLSRESVEIRFGTYNGRIVGKMYIYDFSELTKLMNSENHPVTPEELEEAYYKSTCYVSDWFYADDTELYNYALKCVILSDRNGLKGINQNRNDIFSDGIIDVSEDEKIKLASEPSRYASDGMELAEGYSYRGNSYIAYYPDMMVATFYSLDWNNDYDTGFECYLEKQKADGLWYRVEPLGGGITQANNGSGHFYNVFEEGREHVTFDLAAYPLLPPGNYRLVKPFWDAGSNDHSQYAAFFEFRMSNASADYKSGISYSAQCGQKQYPAGVKEIICTVEAVDNSFIISDIADIERLENGKWVSVRTRPVKANSIGGSYALRFSGMEETIDTDDFDISKAGEYRIRISVGKYDILTDDDMFVNDYDTIYAYFSIV